MAFMIFYRFRFVVITLVALLAVSIPPALVSSSAYASPQTWFVKDGVSNGDGRSEATAFDEIGDAIEVAGAGDTIRVFAGNYSGFTINKALTLLGPYNDTSPGPGSEREEAEEATITGPVNTSGGLTSVIIRGFVLDGSGETGIRIGSNSSDVTISHNEITGFDQGVRSQGNATQFGTSWTISHNYIHDLAPEAAGGSYAIHLRNVKDVVVSENVIRDDISKPGVRRGILLRGTQGTVVRNNDIDLGFTPNQVAANVSSTTDGWPESYYALSVQQKLNDGDNGDDLSIANVDITDNFFRGATLGINLFDLDSKASGIVVSRNTFESVYTGILHRSFGQESDGPINSELTAKLNDFSGARIAAVEAYSISSDFPSPNQFAGITIQGNSLPARGVNIVALDATLNPRMSVVGNTDARGNWWGNASGPAEGAEGPQLFVDSSGWITSFTPDDRRAGDAGFWPVCSSITTDNNLDVAETVLCPQQDARPSRSASAPGKSEESNPGQAAAATSGASAPASSALGNPIPALNAILRLLSLPSAGLDLGQDRVAGEEANVAVEPRVVPAEELLFAGSPLLANSSQIAWSESSGTLTVANPRGGSPLELPVENLMIYEVGGAFVIVTTDNQEVAGVSEDESGVIAALPGDQIISVVSGLPPGVVIRVFLFSTPLDFGSVVSDGNGNAVIVADLPRDFPAGNHTFQLTTANGAGNLVTFAAGVTVTKPAEVTEPGSAPADEPAEASVGIEPEPVESSPTLVLWVVAAIGLLAVAGVVGSVLLRSQKAQ